jgi:hypothetical protein
MERKAKTKTFSFHWGSGYIAEEAQVQGEHNVPTFQLMKYTDGPAVGVVTLRFCQYNHRGMFSRSPLIMGVEEIGMMREALKETPELLALMKQLVAD